MTPRSAPISILLVDDQALLRVGFRMVLEAEDDFTVVGEASDGAQAIALAARLNPDVVLMDVRMPGVDGIEATRQIMAAQPETRIIILTTFDLDEYAFGGLRAGASGFLLKNAEPGELIAAIRTVVSGEASVSPRVTRRLLDLFGTKLPQPETGGASNAMALAALTDRETEVFLAIAEGLSNTELAERFFLSESTVKTHVGRILHKLGLRDRVQAVILAYEVGLVGS
ncbi:MULTISPECIES: response regulator transcription factor [Cryobacterium]|uniref:DNA-binding response regulator, NarL/FixJ family, contains REC and HTH domains n=1 Tax=Cryobacterium levicorallinum TaxID=995038 RepID=A0A1I3D3Y0_9MICO|nr:MULTISPECIES: response regulator transcription factor [Cryobacterium]TFB86822.1 response regulator transcription factor [Cryobacterium levicorallinum]TFD61251.1 response regulator transcription factor [Cryobacterium sp. Hh38]GEP28130.1 DNA-binding response regulator [Cryobacterium levicorallinum]SFH81239.1 DNA-binding response regulator, NarL/FixJ family, contains REC and HTH domains [Cryobacterium levicorallinum]